MLNGLKISSEGLSKLTDFVIQFDKNAFFRMIFTPVTTLGTVKLRAVDQSTIQFLTISGVLLTKTCYYSRRATIAMYSNYMVHTRPVNLHPLF